MFVLKIIIGPINITHQLSNVTNQFHCEDMGGQISTFQSNQRRFNNQKVELLKLGKRCHSFLNNMDNLMDEEVKINRFNFIYTKHPYSKL